MGKVPTSIKVVSILGIIYSAFGILGVPISVFLTFHPLTPTPASDAFLHDPGYLWFSLISGTVKFCLAWLLLVSAIGSLRLRPWARKGMNTYAVLYLIESLTNMALGFVYVLPVTLKAVQSTDPAMIQYVQIGIIVGAAFGILWVLAVSLIILIFFNRKIAVDAFHGIFPAEGTGFPLDDQPTGGVV